MDCGHEELPVLRDLDELVEAVLLEARGVGLYVRWSRGPAIDAGSTSSDELTGVELPGLSASPLQVESWWGDRSLRLWVARRLYDYEHLRERRPEPDVRAWLLRGTEVARGPDNEPLVRCQRALAWVAEYAMQEARGLIKDHNRGWGPLDRYT
ncbi:hypothetical protein E1202_15965 [Saccharopolyspora karakumensis]|uniref:Uncharacterized protein n=1 Tax=Saccharopolyspora karakumensis TaxID=2530386 RepID=A0A4R5BLX4_9PSEU|nr:hypothetical protein E1202_15965 [Saccharopolyspora karakumensis]